MPAFDIHYNYYHQFTSERIWYYHRTRFLSRAAPSFRLASLLMAVEIKPRFAYGHRMSQAGFLLIEVSLVEYAFLTEFESVRLTHFWLIFRIIRSGIISLCEILEILSLKLSFRGTLLRYENASLTFGCRCLVTLTLIFLLLNAWIPVFQTFTPCTCCVYT